MSLRQSVGESSTKHRQQSSSPESWQKRTSRSRTNTTLTALLEDSLAGKIFMISFPKPTRPHIIKTNRIWHVLCVFWLCVRNVCVVYFSGTKRASMTCSFKTLQKTALRHQTSFPFLQILLHSMQKRCLLLMIALRHSQQKLKEINRYGSFYRYT